VGAVCLPGQHRHARVDLHRSGVLAVVAAGDVALARGSPGPLGPGRCLARGRGVSQAVHADPRPLPCPSPTPDRSGRGRGDDRRLVRNRLARLRSPAWARRTTGRGFQ
jgi:hypothetical protein